MTSEVQDNGRVQVSPDREALSHAVAEALVALIDRTLATQPRFSIALAGGNTPQRLYELLAVAPYRDQIAWNRVYLFWGDERFVPHDDPESNYGTADRTLLCHGLLTPDHILPIPTDTTTPQHAADAYATTLRRFFEGQETTFDLTLLGLGKDGHTASLFVENAPQRDLAENTAEWVHPVEAPPRYPTRTRITLTLSCLNQSRHIFFLVSGNDKRDALHAILDEQDTTLPAAYVQARDSLTWFVDEAAYGKQ